MHNVIRLASIRHEYIQDALLGLGHQWGDVVHITATPSLRHAIAKSDGISITVHTLMQLIEHIAHRAQLEVHQDALAHAIHQRKTNDTPSGIANLTSQFNANQLQLKRIKEVIRTFPSVTADDFADQLNAWQKSSHIQRFHHNITATNIIVERINATPEPIPTYIKAIYEARYTVRDSIRTLIDSGLTPDDMRVAETDAFMQWVVGLWRELEERIPELTWMRNVYWDVDDAQSALGARIMAELWRTVWQPAQRTALVLHGFHSYTPVQWALFRLLQQQTDIPIIWVMHDDGDNPAFESWRIFYDTKWYLPAPLTMPCKEQPLANAQLLLAGFRGAPVHAEATTLAFIEYQTPAQFVSAMDETSSYNRFSKRYTPQLYAAAPDQIRRYFQRLDKASQHTVVDMSDLPLGIFLTRLHQTWPHTYRHDIEIGTSHVNDMLASGYVPAPAHLYEVWQRVEPFFADCQTTDEWRSRARQLCHLQSLAGRIGPKKANHNDKERLKNAARNHYRLVSWVDITDDEARHVADAIETILTVIEQLCDSDTIEIYQHFEVLQRQLNHGLKNLPPADRTQVLERLQWFDRSFQGRFYTEAVIEAVQIVLGQPAALGQNELDEEEHQRVRSLQTLDALSFARSREPIHIANMADGVFPTVEASIGWPFEVNHFADQSHMAIQVFNALQECAHIRNVYTLWVALDGIEAPITISWIRQIAGEERNRAAVLELLAQSTVRATVAPHIHQHIGGVAVDRYKQKATRTNSKYSTLYKHHDASVNDELIRQIWQSIPREAGSAWVLCGRRFVLQWALGSSISYRAEHHQRMLYGNFKGATERQGDRDYAPEADAQTVHLMWPQMRDGIKMTYEQHAAVGQDKTSYKWLYTMKGSTRSDLDDAERTLHDKALRYIISREVLPKQNYGKYQLFPDTLGGFGRQICDNCPVKQRCAAAIVVEGEESE